MEPNVNSQWVSVKGVWVFTVYLQLFWGFVIAQNKSQGKNTLSLCGFTLELHFSCPGLDSFELWFIFRASRCLENCLRKSRHRHTVNEDPAVLVKSGETASAPSVCSLCSPAGSHRTWQGQTSRSQLSRLLGSCQGWNQCSEPSYVHRLDC